MKTPPKYIPGPALVAWAGYLPQAEDLDRPTVVRRREPAEVRDRAEVQLRVALHALGLSLDAIDREVDRLLALTEAA